MLWRLESASARWKPTPSPEPRAERAVTHALSKNIIYIHTYIHLPSSSRLALVAGAHLEFFINIMHFYISSFLNGDCISPHLKVKLFKILSVFFPSVLSFCDLYVLFLILPECVIVLHCNGLYLYNRNFTCNAQCYVLGA